ncbi:MAG: hypothetical protein IPK59_10010 [Rhodospirillaceae bacterium]|nr:hypothetical protein [Rhodospirillaceae bacterium]
MARKVVKAKKAQSKIAIKATKKKAAGKKAAVKKSIAKKTAAKKSSSKKSTARVRVRMYRIGVGDCFLLTFPRKGAADFKMLIDCGVHQSQSGGGDRIREVVADIETVTGGHLDVIVGTHEHWDHISGFKQAEDIFQRITVGEIWFAWTEDDKDPLARQLAGKKEKALKILDGARQRMRLMGLGGDDDPFTSIMGFFGDGAGKKLAEAGKVLKGRTENIVYHRPGDKPIELPNLAARVFVLGPPCDIEMIGKSDPTKKESEVFELADAELAADPFEAAIAGQYQAVFSGGYVVPLAASKGISFFDRHYWSAAGIDPLQDREDTTQDWRRIDSDWLGAATSLALKLDHDTNNTSLVLAIELGPKDKDGDVLLFAADAQVGNWLSWQEVEWEDYGGRKITGPDLLRRTRLYKVGHHASHNATLRELGLEMMNELEVALVPTDSAMAKKVKWGTLPWPPLLKALDKKTGERHRVVRSDEDGAKAPGLVETPLYYEISL